MDIVTFDVLFEVLRKLLGKRGMEEKEIRDLTLYVLNFFGYDDIVVDNILTPTDRHVFNTLEELGILTTIEDEVTVARGKLWRIHYWTYRKDNIERILNEEEKEEEESAEDIYRRIFQDEEE